MNVYPAHLRGMRPVVWPANRPEPDAAAPWAALAALTLLAAVCRAVGLNSQLWYDEILTLLGYVRMPLGEILTTYNSQNQHMLYSVLARISIVAFGDTAWALRLPAAVMGVACIPALYAFARQAAMRREALLACALLAVSYHHVWFSQNARGYTGLMLATLLAGYHFMRGAREAAWHHWLAFGFWATFGMYVHLSMGFIVAGMGLVWLWLASRCFLHRQENSGDAQTRTVTTLMQPLAGFALSGILTLLLYLPVLSQMLGRTVGSVAAAGPGEAVRAEWKNPLWLALETLRGLAGGGGWPMMTAILLAAGIALAGMALYWRQDKFAVALMLLPGIVTAVALLALSRNLWPRFFFFAIGFAFLFLVRGAMWLGEASARVLPPPALGGAARGTAHGTVLVALMILASAWQMRAAWIYPKQDYRGAMEFIEREAQAGDTVLLVGLTRIPYQKYYQQDWTFVETPEALRAAEANSMSGRVWVLYTIPIYDESRYPALWNVLKTEYTTVKVCRGTMGGGEIYLCRNQRERGVEFKF